MTNFKVGLSILFLLFLSVPAFSKLEDNWIQVARKVGQSETASARDSALQSLRSQKDLNRRLLSSLKGPNRALALDAIAALNLKSIVPELLKLVPSDTDGFLILTLNSLLDEKNKDSVIPTYQSMLTLQKGSPAAQVAALEPMGRVGHHLPEETVLKLSQHSYPEVRSATLSYLRTMMLIHHSNSHLSVLTKSLEANEFQIRLQAISLMKELSDDNSGPLRKDALIQRCQREGHAKLREQCLSLLRQERVKA